jgi:hypothetical protein
MREPVRVAPTVMPSGRRDDEQLQHARRRSSSGHAATIHARSGIRLANEHVSARPNSGVQAPAAEACTKNPPSSRFDSTDDDDSTHHEAEHHEEAVVPSSRK